MLARAVLGYHCPQRKARGRQNTYKVQPHKAHPEPASSIQLDQWLVHFAVALKPFALVPG